ncbi:hypothetical protein FNF31_04345 [Cafeteria roenbergensis]|uniref:PX domain-containing protein n=1 Tax=Cafeteria roenbergensis TaxID=33653 RepID=A0A5A8D5A1_CAFRO|nr:hypothetical protein FNF31_04345 [Cafeteria roenbergensis]
MAEFEALYRRLVAFASLYDGRSAAAQLSDKAASEGVQAVLEDDMGEASAASGESEAQLLSPVAAPSRSKTRLVLSAGSIPKHPRPIEPAVDTLALEDAVAMLASYDEVSAAIAKQVATANDVASRARRVAGAAAAAAGQSRATSFASPASAPGAPSASRSGAAAPSGWLGLRMAAMFGRKAAQPRASSGAAGALRHTEGGDEGASSSTSSAESSSLSDDEEGVAGARNRHRRRRAPRTAAAPPDATETSLAPMAAQLHAPSVRWSADGAAPMAELATAEGLAESALPETAAEVGGGIDREVAAASDASRSLFSAGDARTLTSAGPVGGLPSWRARVLWRCSEGSSWERRVRLLAYDSSAIAVGAMAAAAWIKGPGSPHQGRGRPGRPARAAASLAPGTGGPGEDLVPATFPLTAPVAAVLDLALPPPPTVLAEDRHARAIMGARRAKRIAQQVARVVRASAGLLLPTGGPAARAAMISEAEAATAALRPVRRPGCRARNSDAVSLLAVARDAVVSPTGAGSLPVADSSCGVAIRGDASARFSLFGRARVVLESVSVVLPELEAEGGAGSRPHGVRFAGAGGFGSRGDFDGSALAGDGARLRPPGQISLRVWGTGFGSAAVESAPAAGASLSAKAMADVRRSTQADDLERRVSVRKEAIGGISAAGRSRSATARAALHLRRASVSARLRSSVAGQPHPGASSGDWPADGASPQASSPTAASQAGSETCATPFVGIDGENNSGLRATASGAAGPRLAHALHSLSDAGQGGSVVSSAAALALHGDQDGTAPPGVRASHPLGWQQWGGDDATADADAVSRKAGTGTLFEWLGGALPALPSAVGDARFLEGMSIRIEALAKDWPSGGAVESLPVGRSEHGVTVVGAGVVALDGCLQHGFAQPAPGVASLPDSLEAGAARAAASLASDGTGRSGARLDAAGRVQAHRALATLRQQVRTGTVPPHLTAGLTTRAGDDSSSESDAESGTEGSVWAEDDGSVSAGFAAGGQRSGRHSTGDASSEAVVRQHDGDQRDGSTGGSAFAGGSEGGEPAPGAGDGPATRTEPASGAGGSAWDDTGAGSAGGEAGDGDEAAEFDEDEEEDEDELAAGSGSVGVKRAAAATALSCARPEATGGIRGGKPGKTFSVPLWRAGRLVGWVSGRVRIVVDEAPVTRAARAAVVAAAAAREAAVHVGRGSRLFNALELVNNPGAAAAMAQLAEDATSPPANPEHGPAGLTTAARRSGMAVALELVREAVASTQGGAGGARAGGARAGGAASLGAALSRESLQRAFTASLQTLVPLTSPYMGRGLVHSLAVAVPSSSRRRDAQKHYTVYSVRIGLGRLQWRRSHRFSAFDELDQRVRAEVARLPGCPVGDLPPSLQRQRLSSSTVPGFVERRRASLERYLRALVRCPAAWAGRALLAFLDSPGQHLRTALLTIRVWHAARAGVRRLPGPSDGDEPGGRVRGSHEGALLLRLAGADAAEERAAAEAAAVVASQEAQEAARAEAVAKALSDARRQTLLWSMRSFASTPDSSSEDRSDNGSFDRSGAGPGRRDSFSGRSWATEDAEEADGAPAGLEHEQKQEWDSGSSMHSADLEGYEPVAAQPRAKPWEAWTSGVGLAGAQQRQHSQFDEADGSWLVEETRDDVDAAAMACRTSARRPGPRTRLGVSHASGPPAEHRLSPRDARGRSDTPGLAQVAAAARRGRGGAAEPGSLGGTVAAIAESMHAAMEHEAERLGVAPDELDVAVARPARRRAAEQAYTALVSSAVAQARSGTTSTHRAARNHDDWADAMPKSRRAAEQALGDATSGGGCVGGGAAAAPAMSIADDDEADGWSVYTPSEAGAETEANDHVHPAQAGEGAPQPERGPSPATSDALSQRSCSASAAFPTPPGPEAAGTLLAPRTGHVDPEDHDADSASDDDSDGDGDGGGGGGSSSSADPAAAADEEAALLLAAGMLREDGRSPAPAADTAQQARDEAIIHDGSVGTGEGSDSDSVPLGASLDAELLALLREASAARRRGAAGVYAGGAVTRTRTNKTLYVTAIPSGVTMDMVEDLFKGEPGFLGLRPVRRMCFVDFEDARYATSAMRKHQGHAFGGKGSGIAVDFDKDSTKKRDHNAEKQRLQRMMREQLMATDSYACVVCGDVVLNLEPGHDLEALPRRSTDGATAVSETTTLRRLRVCRVPRRLLKRGGDVAEWQYPVACPNCNVLLGYRAAELGTPSPWLYLHDGAVKLAQRARVATTTHDVEEAGTGVLAPAGAASVADQAGAVVVLPADDEGAEAVEAQASLPQSALAAAAAGVQSGDGDLPSEEEPSAKRGRAGPEP